MIYRQITMYRETYMIYRLTDYDTHTHTHTYTHTHTHTHYMYRQIKYIQIIIYRQTSLC